MNWYIFTIIAGILINFGIIFQIVKTLQSKSVDEMSYIFGILMVIGLFMWGIFGISVQMWSVIISMFVAGFLTIFMIILKIIYSK